MAAFNKVILLGNLTCDIETRSTGAGTTVAKFGLAVSRKFSDRDGNQKEETAFVDVDAFGKQAEVLAKYLRKGSPLMVEGRLRFDQWENAEGQKRSKLGVILEGFQFIPTGQRAGGSDSQSGAASGSDDSLDEDVPF
jgi:single-strand DNA-binding protein